MNNKILSFIKFFIGWPISILSLYFVFKIINPKLSVILPLVKNANIYTAVLAIFCLLIYFFLRGFLWKIILKTKGYNLKLKDIMFDWGVSELKRYTPGNIWSFLARIFSFSNRGVDKKVIVESLILEALLVMLGSIIVSLLSLSFVLDFFWIGNKELIKIVIIFLSITLSLFYIYGHKVIKASSKGKLSYLSSFLSKGGSSEKFYMLFVSILTMFFFGLGSYFVMYSFFVVEVSKVFILTGFFTLSLLIGYLSLITPMGLGVREWIITLGLSSILSISGAGLVSILSRIFFIVAEIIFLILAYTWSVLKSKTIIRIEDIVKKHKHEAILIALVLIYILYFATASFLRHDNFFTGRFDLGNVDQTVWNSANGRIFEMTNPDGTNNTSRLAFHSDFILIFFSPLYFIWSNPKIMLLVQTVILSLGAIYVFLIAKNVLKNKNLSLVLSFLYLISPAVNYTNLYDFHAVTLTTTFLLAGFYYLLKKRYFLFTSFVILSALTKEQLWLTAGILFSYFTLKEYLYNKSVKRINNLLAGAILTIFSFTMFYLLLWIIIPSITGGEHFALSYYSNFGNTPSEIAINIIFNPIKTFSVIFHPDNILYLGQLFLPLGLTSIFSPFYLILTSPDLMVNLLSNNSQLHQIYYQYSAAITPFVFISSIFGIKALSKKVRLLSLNVLVVYLLITGIYFAYLYGPLPGAKNENLAMFDRPLSNKKLISDYVSGIPKKYKVTASNNLGAHLSQREYIFTIPKGIEEADIIAFLLNDSYAKPSLNEQRIMAETLEYNKNYVLLIKNKDFIVFKKVDTIRN